MAHPKLLPLRDIEKAQNPELVDLKARIPESQILILDGSTLEDAYQFIAKAEADESSCLWHSYTMRELIQKVRDNLEKKPNELSDDDRLPQIVVYPKHEQFVASESLLALYRSDAQEVPYGIPNSNNLRDQLNRANFPVISQNDWDRIIFTRQGIENGTLDPHDLEMEITRICGADTASVTHDQFATSIKWLINKAIELNRYDAVYTIAKVIKNQSRYAANYALALSQLIDSEEAFPEDLATANIRSAHDAALYVLDYIPNDYNSLKCLLADAINGSTDVPLEVHLNPGNLFIGSDTVRPFDLVGHLLRSNHLDPDLLYYASFILNGNDTIRLTYPHEVWTSGINPEEKIALTNSECMVAAIGLNPKSAKYYARLAELTFARSGNREISFPYFLQLIDPVTDDLLGGYLDAVELTEYPLSRPAALPTQLMKLAIFYDRRNPQYFLELLDMRLRSYQNHLDLIITVSPHTCTGACPDHEHDRLDRGADTGVQVLREMIASDPRNSMAYAMLGQYKALQNELVQGQQKRNGNILYQDVFKPNDNSFIGETDQDLFQQALAHHGDHYPTKAYIKAIAWLMENPDRRLVLKNRVGEERRINDSVDMGIYIIEVYPSIPNGYNYLFACLKDDQCVRFDSNNSLLQELDIDFNNVSKLDVARAICHLGEASPVALPYILHNHGSIRGSLMPYLHKIIRSLAKNYSTQVIQELFRTLDREGPINAADIWSNPALYRSAPYVNRRGQITPTSLVEMAWYIDRVRHKRHNLPRIDRMLTDQMISHFVQHYRENSRSHQLPGGAQVCTPMSFNLNTFEIGDFNPDRKLVMLALLEEDRYRPDIWGDLKDALERDEVLTFRDERNNQIELNQKTCLMSAFIAMKERKDTSPESVLRLAELIDMLEPGETGRVMLLGKLYRINDIRLIENLLELVPKELHGPIMKELARRLPASEPEIVHLPGRQEGIDPADIMTQTLGLRFNTYNPFSYLYSSMYWEAAWKFPSFLISKVNLRDYLQRNQ